VESVLSFREGETKQYSEHARDNELVFTQDLGNGGEQVVAIPQARLADRGEIQTPGVPFTVRVEQFATNADVLERGRVIELYGQLKGALGMVEGKYGGGDLVELAKEAQQSEGRADVWRAALRAVGETDLGDVAAATGRVSADADRLAKLRGELKERLRKQMLEANVRQGDENAYVAEALREGRELTEANVPAATAEGVGSRAFVIPRPERNDEKGRNMPYALVDVLEGGKSVGKFLASPVLRRQEFEAGGKKWELSLRAERYYLPYTLKLLKATHDVYQGTDIPKDYRSRVLLDNSGKGERRETEIYMNQPLRYAGLTFYQSQMGVDQRNEAVKTSGLQVVRGKFLGFAVVFLAATTILLVPFAIKYHEEVGSMLWPLVLAQTAVIASIVIAINSRRETETPAVV
jgi:hypothetical protein